MSCLMRLTIFAVLAASVLVAGPVGSEQEQSHRGKWVKPNSYTQVIIAQAAEGVLGLLEYGVKKRGVEGVIDFYTKVCQGHRDLDGDGINDPELTPALSRGLMASTLMEMDTHLMEAWNRGDFTEEDKDVLVADFMRAYIDLLEVQCEAIHHGLHPKTDNSMQDDSARGKWEPDSYTQAIIARAAERVLSLFERDVKKEGVLAFYAEVCQRNGVTPSLSLKIRAATLARIDAGEILRWASGNHTDEDEDDLADDFRRAYRHMLEVQCEAIRHSMASKDD